MDYKSGPLMVIPTAYEHQFWIKGAIEPHPDNDYIKNVVSVIGHYGSYGPHLFAAAPEMFDALLEAQAVLYEIDRPLLRVKNAISKAEGK